MGDENIFIFGLTADEVARRRRAGYNPHAALDADPELGRVLDVIQSGGLSPGKPGLFAPIVRSLLDGGDTYMLLADFAAYRACQERVAGTYRNPALWTRMSILNVARMGRFSSDRTIREYARGIWGVEAVPVEIPVPSSSA